MKRVTVLLVIVVAILMMPPSGYNSPNPIGIQENPQYRDGNSFFASSASGSGDARTAIQFASRQVMDLSLPITNSYASTNTHAGTLDLSDYLIPGWSLYKAVITANSMTAVAEHETMGITPETYIVINNNTGQITDALYQEFYDQPHDGKLENYTIRYICTYYSASLGDAYLGVRSDYSDTQTNMTSWLTPFSVTFVDTDVIHDVSSESVILSADTSYYVVIDGTTMQGAYAGGWRFNEIYWSATATTLGLETGYNLRGDNWYIYQGIERREAFLNYAYTPWNQTSGSALTYSSPTQVSLKGNSTNMQGISWTFTDSTNITRIDFNTNQSINLDYDLTLWYRKSVTTSTSWDIPSSGDSVEWSIETTLDYPGVTQANYLNISIPSSWDPSGLYNSTHTISNHTTYSNTGSMIICAEMYGDTWTLKLTSENLLKSVMTFRSVDDTEVVSRFIMTSNLDINSTIQEPDTDPVTTGTVNLVVWHSGMEFWSPSDQPVINGQTHYFWNISNPKAANGEYIIETEWSNGTEAGYLSKSLLLCYPTTLTADTSNIAAYTDSSFDIKVNLNDTFTPQGLNGTYASAVYSFDGAANQSMTDLNNGTWTATVSTTSKSFGQYTVIVYATGYALENQSLQITASLIHDTETLTVLWSNTDNITYIESTELSVAYNRIGSIPITDATVNVTIDTTTWTLVWDEPSQTYKFTFHGSDNPPGYGVHDLTIRAWKAGHKAQVDTSQTLTLQDEPTTLDIQWSNTNDITYVESTTLIANYTMSDGSPISGALVNVTIGSNTWTMVWNGITEVYEYTFDGNAAQPGFDTHGVTVDADKLGYEYRTNSTLTLTINEEPTTLFIEWNPDFDITYIEQTYLIVHYNMSDGTPISGATVNVTINTQVFDLTWHAPSQTYRLLINGSDNPPGFGTYPLVIQADLFGFESRSDNSKTLILRKDPTTLILSWSDGDTISYIEQTTLAVSYKASNGSAIRNAIVNVTINTYTWSLIWDEGSETYRKTFLGTNDPPGFGTHSLTVNAELFGFVGQTDSTEHLTISEEVTTLFVTWSYDFNISYIEQTYLIVHYNMSDGTPISGAKVNVTIDSDVWTLVWYPSSQIYRVLFNGTDDPPGIGIHALSIQADKFGYESRIENTKTLVITEDPTTLILSWSDGNSITYIEQTTLSASYTMSNGSAIRGATVNMTIGTDYWVLTWHEGSQTYRKTFLGTNDPPGFGTHGITLKADLFGFVGRTDSSKQLMISEEPTTMTISWSNGYNITYVEQTTLSVSYRMSDTTSISGATVTATIGGDVWTLTWNPGSESYETTFRGDDDPPGIGEYSITIQASLFGFESQFDNAESLIVEIEPTSLALDWWLSDTISYVSQTVIYANFTMSNGSAVVGAFVTVAIGATNMTFEWNAISEVYSIILKGDDPSYQLGANAVTIQATLFGYEQQTDTTQTFTVLEEQTSLIPTWSPDNNITYFESSTLSVRYEMSNGTAIPNAVVNITIGFDFWVLVWNPLSEAYEHTFSGADNPPGYGIHNVELRAAKYGYESRIDSTQQFIIRLEDTKVSFEWVPSSTITYVEQTKLRIFYQFTNGSPVLSAMVNITRGPTTWIAVWNSTSNAYEYTWLGTDNPPGLGSYLLLIKAWKANHEGITDTSQTLTINQEPTEIQATWSIGNNITYVQSTRLMVNFTTSSGVTILDAYVEVTIGSDSWTLLWNDTSHLYEHTFAGADSPPGLGTHSLTIGCWQSGYVTAIDTSETLILREEPTSLIPSWTPGDTITYVDSTLLSVRYLMSNGDPIPGASVNVTIGLDVWVLVWNPVSEAYEYTFSGTDDPPGLGVHSLYIQASKWGFTHVSNSHETLILTEGLTSLVISWSNTNNVSYVSQTTLSVRYQMSNTTAISGAVLNVTINGYVWNLIWDAASETYNVTIRGDDNPPGYGTHSVVIKASKYGFVSKEDTSQEFTIRLEETSVSYAWSPSDTITYTGQTTIRISYLMSNNTSIVDAIVNVSIGLSTWTAVWNAGSEAYEYTWQGNDNPPGLGIHQLIIEAWKVNYVSINDSSQTLRINEEPTTIQAYWTNGNQITYVQSTTLQVNYTDSHGSTILGASVDVTIGTDNWILSWNPTSQLYEIMFSGSDDPPGLGTHGLSIRGIMFGYETTVNILMTLRITGELGSISSELIEGSTISYVEFTTLAVNYTMSNGTAIPLAVVNVTISGILWNLTWHPASETYRLQFNGTDSPPGFGTHNLIIKAWREGFDGQTDSSLFLTILEESTTLTIYWDDYFWNSVPYFGYTYLFVNYRMSNGTDITSANVNVTYLGTTWNLEWNSTEVAFGIRFNGSDDPPGLGTHSLTIRAYEFGFQYQEQPGVTLNLTKEFTVLSVAWSNTNNITYVEHTDLIVYYTMYRDGSIISTGTVTATIGVDVFVLTWNATSGAYHYQFTGDMVPPGLGDSMLIDIHASGDVYGNKTAVTVLTITEEPTSATVSWSSNNTFDWTENVIFSVDFRDTYGTLIDGASTKSVYVNGTEYELLGTNGTYWIEFNNTFDLGLHNVWVNLSKDGYESVTALSITFTITEAPTAFTITWSSTVIDYLGQADLTFDYYYMDTGISVPTSGVLANVTIDGIANIRLENRTNLWYANLTGVSLDLGVHSIVIRAWAYGYEYSKTMEFVTVNEVDTDPLDVTWIPSNLTIEYTDLINLTVDYTYYGGDVPGTAIVNVSIDGKLYPLTYSGSLWRVSIPGNELGIGLRTATISAWLYGYALKTDITSNINVTEAANSFSVTWEPLSLEASYIDTVNASVVYTQDYQPIVGATVELTINGTQYILVYDAIDEVWYFSMKARDIGLGTWNVTVTANKTGYVDGRDSFILHVTPASTNLFVLNSTASIYYDEEVTMDIYYQLLNSSTVPGAVLTLEIDGIEHMATWITDHWTYTIRGDSLGLGVNPVNIHVSAFGFETRSYSFDIDVSAIPTSCTTPSSTVVIFAYETTTITFTWVDTKNSVYIPGYVPEVTWSDTYSIFDLGNGSYSLEIDSDSMHVGIYEFHVNFVRLGYENGTSSVSIDIREIPLALVYQSEIHQFENETVVVDVEVFNAPHATSVDWAQVIVELEGVQYPLVYDNETMTYSVGIWLGSLAPDIYQLNLTISAIDCETEHGIIQLEIDPKVEYTLSLEVDEEVQAGQTIEITVLATYEAGIVDGFWMTIHILIEREQSVPQEHAELISTNSEGLAILEFAVPLDATKLTMWADFEPSLGEWPAESNTEVREVSPAGMNLLIFIRSLFENPITLIIFVSGVGLPVAGLFMLRRRRGAPRAPVGEMSKSIVSASPTPSAPVGEMESLQEIIRKSPNGMTRAQIAQSLEISTSKASALVRKLLASGLGFEEINEGKLRRIRFNNLE